MKGEVTVVIEYLVLLKPTSYILYYKYGGLYSIEALCISVKPNNHVTRFRNHIWKYMNVTTEGLQLTKLIKWSNFKWNTKFRSNDP
jgi:hypothetical protein